MANRKERIATLIDKNIRDIIQFEVKNDKIGFISVTDVVTSTDFSYTKVYVSFLGAKYPHQNLEELEKAKGFIRSSLAKKLDIRKVPELTFYLDDTFDKIEQLENALKKDEIKINKIKKGEK
jgi:ribosome-binding factor A